MADTDNELYRVEERNLLLDALNEAVSAAGHDALIGHWAYLNAVLDPVRRGQLVAERLKGPVNER